MSDFTLAWIILFVMAGVVEGAALANKTAGDTLSEHLWRWAAIKDKPKGWRIRRFALLGCLCWLCAHLLTGGRF